MAGFFISPKIAEEIKLRIKSYTCHLQQKTGDTGLHLNQQIHWVSFLDFGGGEPESWVQNPDDIMPLHKLTCLGSESSHSYMDLSKRVPFSSTGVWLDSTSIRGTAPEAGIQSSKSWDTKFSSILIQKKVLAELAKCIEHVSNVT